jgi:acyl-CoA synthetase (AMP-forming)/AMP-acid ligase II
METLRDMWLSALHHSPGQIAIVDEAKRLTYKQVMDRAFRLGNALSQHGVCKRDRVAVLSMNRSEWYDVYATCNTFGFIVTTVNFRLAAPEILFILKDSASKVLIYEAQYAATVEQLKPQLADVEIYICIDGAADGAFGFEQFIASGEPAAPTTPVAPEDPAHLIYTSGTTGRPKGVIRSQRADARNAEALALMMNMSFGGSLLLIMPMFHIGALAEAHGQILCRGMVVLHRIFDPVKVLETLERDRIEATHMAPTMVQMFLDVPNIRDYNLSAFKTLCYAAAPMPVTVLKRGIELLGSIFVDCYGATEVGAATAFHKLSHVINGSEQETRRLASVGQALTHTELKIIDDDGMPCATGQVGEVCIRSDSTLDYYWNNHVATMQSIVDGWYKSGDMGYLDEQGFLFLVDRKKDMIISGGENIYCREVEEALMEHPGVADVAVIGVPDAHWGEAVKAVVVTKVGASLSADDLIAHCLLLIARYKRPKTVEFVDSLPRLPSGKVNKVSLREQYRSE